MIRHASKQIYTLIGSGALLAVLGGVGYLALTHSDTAPSSAIAPAQLVDGTTYAAVGTYHAANTGRNGMKSYASHEFGMSWSYPQDYLLFETSEQTGPYTFHSFVMASSLPIRQTIAYAEAGFAGEGPESVVITFISSAQPLTLEQWLLSEHSSYTNYHSDDPSNALAPTTVAGAPAFKYHSDRGLYASDYSMFQKGMWTVIISAPSDLKDELATVQTSITLQP